MNAYFKFLIYFFMIFSFLSVVYSNSFNVCGVNLQQPWFEVKDSQSQLSVLVIDSQGDIFIRGETLSSNSNEFSTSSFTIGNLIAFNSDYRKYTSISSWPIIATNEFTIRNSQGSNVAYFSDAGDIRVSGDIVHEGSQAACSEDGWYCRSDGEISDLRDYFCDITGNQEGFCTYDVSSTQDCSQQNHEYCSGSQIWERLYGCSSTFTPQNGTVCSLQDEVFRQNCPSYPSTSENTCLNETHLQRVTTFNNGICNNNPTPNCDISTSTTTNVIDCSATGNVCSGGSCSTPDSCMFNGNVVPHGDSVEAFETSSVPNGNTCNSEQRYCNNGVLNGSYQYDTCSEQTICTPGETDSRGCTSSANTCGMTNSGTESRTCTSSGDWGSWGTCSAVAPPDSDCNVCTPGETQIVGSCTSSANTCGNTNSGNFVQTCTSSGNWGTTTCDATTPSDPANLGNSCTSSANTCGMTSSGTIQCDGTCSAVTPPDSDCNLCTPGETREVGSCTSSANTCGDTNSGNFVQTCQPDGSWGTSVCSAVTPSDPANLGNSCTSSANTCGDTNSGTIQCDGTCSAVTPSDPANLGNSCTQSNVCGSNSGTIQCDGTCSATAPTIPLNHGQICESPPNACDDVNTGTILCDGTCSASLPQDPPNLGNSCTSSANSCGMTNSGTIQCDGTCSATTPSDSLCSCSWQGTGTTQFGGLCSTMPPSGTCTCGQQCWTEGLEGSCLQEGLAIICEPGVNAECDSGYCTAVVITQYTCQ